MGVFGNKRKQVTIDSVIEKCRNYAGAMKEFYESGRYKLLESEWDERNRIFYESGIDEFTKGSKYSNCDQMQISSLKICVKEIFGHIISVRQVPKRSLYKDKEDLVTVMLFQGYDRNVSMTFKVSIEAPRKKWEKKYGHLKTGDAFLLDAPAKLYYKNSQSGVTTTFTRPYKQEKSYTAFEFRLYL